MEKHHQHLHLSRHIHLRDMLRSRYNDLVLADTLRHVALAMISLFIPIFLLEKGYSMMTIALFELGMFIVATFFHYLAVEYMQRIGVKKTLILSYFLNIILYLVLFNADELMTTLGATLYLVTVGLFSIAAATIYWTAHHIYFFRTTKAEESGRKTGILFAIPVSIGIISPFLGGVLISNYGFKAAFLASTILLAAAAYSLFFSRNIEVPKCKLDWKCIIDKGSMRKNMIYIVQGFGFTATAFLWPVFLFFASIKLATIGLLYLFSNIAYAIISYLSGKITDRYGNKKMIIIGSFGWGSSVILRSLATSIFSITAWQTMGGTFGSLLHIPLEVGFYKCSYDDFYNSIMNRELYMYIGRIGLILFFIFVMSQFKLSTAFIISLITAGLVTFTLSLLVRKKSSIVT